MEKFPEEVQRIREEGFELLGAPIGSREFCEQCAKRRVEKIQEVLDNLKTIDDAQVELALLRSCLGLPRIAFTLRSAPPRDIRKAMAMFDEAIEKTVADRLKIYLDEETRLQWGLPVRMGGFGIPKAQDVAAPAYLGNALLALPFVQSLWEDEEVGMEDMKGVEETWRRMVKTLEEDVGEIAEEAEEAIEEWEFHLRRLRVLTKSRVPSQKTRNLNISCTA